MSKVILRPISRNKWAGGIIHYKNCATYLSPYYTRTGGTYTGFTPEDTDTRTRLERAVEVDLSPGSSFWETYFIRIGDKDVYIDTDSPRGELDSIFLKGHKRVAKNINSINPGHDFVLLDEEEEATTVNTLNRVKRQAFKEFDKMSMQDKRKALRIYGYNADSSSDEIIENRLNEQIEKDPAKFFKLWVENESRDTEYLVKQAISQAVMTKTKNVYKYGEEIIGHSLEDVVDYLDNPLNQDLKITILKSIKK